MHALRPLSRRFRPASPALLVLAAALLPIAARAQDARGFAESERIMPAKTRGWVSVSDAAEFRRRFDRTHYGALLKDPSLEPFIKTFRDQAGNSGTRQFSRLGLTLDDILAICGGECALGGVESPTGRLAIVGLVDATGHEAEARALVEKIERNLVAAKGTKMAAAAGSPFIAYSLPPIDAGSRTVADGKAVFGVVGSAFLIGDDPALVAQVAGTLAAGRGDCLATLPGFVKVMERCGPQVPATAPVIRWFLDPLPFAKAYAATHPPREKRKGPDYVAILGRQGFDAIKGAGGTIACDDAGHAVRHHTMVYAPPLAGRQPFSPARFDLAARMLQFTDVDAIEPQPWVPRDVSGWTSLEWDLQNAFTAVETLVDDIVGEKGVYDDVIASVKEDPDGPQIDLEKDLVACLGTRVTLITDHATPIDTDAERIVIAVEARDPARVARTVAKSMSIDNDMQKIDVQGHVAWELIDRSSSIPKLVVETPGLAPPTSDHDDEAHRRRARMREREEKLLPHSVVTVAHGHLMVASHRDILERVLATGGGIEALGSAADYGRAAAELNRLLPGAAACRSFSREAEVVRPAYEMLRQGLMPKSKSVTGQLLNGLLGDGKPGSVREQRIDGSTLPDFESIRRHFGTSGIGMQSLPDGWYMTGLSLPRSQQEPEVARRPVAPPK